MDMDGGLFIIFRFIIPITLVIIWMKDIVVYALEMMAYEGDPPSQTGRCIRDIIIAVILIIYMFIKYLEEHGGSVEYI